VPKAEKKIEPAAVVEPAKPQPIFKAKKPAASDEELQRLSEARKKGAEARASREADFLARMDAERNQVSLNPQGSIIVRHSCPNRGSRRTPPPPPPTPC
jgi:hypothetical protein